jgi:hypothetical protein
MKTIETDSAIYIIFFRHDEFISYINANFENQLDIRLCVPGITDVKPPHYIFLDLQCIVNFCGSQIRSKYLSISEKDDMIIDSLIANINHEFLHKVIFEIPEINSHLQKSMYILNKIEIDGMEHIVSSMEPYPYTK